jgi:hypothetical protein
MKTILYFLTFLGQLCIATPFILFTIYFPIGTISINIHGIIWFGFIFLTTVSEVIFRAIFIQWFKSKLKT